MFRKFDILLTVFPNSDRRTSKLRPTLAVQDSSDLRQTTVAMISSTHREGETRLHIEKDSEDNQTMNLLQDSTIYLDNIQTVENTSIVRKIGFCSPKMAQKINEKLKKAFKI